MSHSFHSYVRLLEGKLPLNTIKSPLIIIKSSNHLAIPVQPMPGLEEERKDSEDSECCTPDAGRNVRHYFCCIYNTHIYIVCYIEIG